MAGTTDESDLYMTFFYIVISMKIIYILIAVIVNLHKDSTDIRFIPMRKLKVCINAINEIISFALIIYLFNPFTKKTGVTVVGPYDKISLFLFALIGLSNVQWNSVLSLVGVHIPFFDL
jgi:hypothetical protein